MSVALKKLEGVESVKVSLEQGLATIRLKPGNSVRLAEIRRAVKEQGFTPKGAQISAVGDVTSSAGKLWFRVGGSDEQYQVAPAPDEQWDQKAGSNLVVRGMIRAPDAKESPEVIQITAVSENASE